ncbi:alkaline phosphatase D family protein [Oscillatoria laete-virens NRMC-F 0139]|nr:alkaline phosphatase D family protein [Oscillatoria laete-virens]MDL5051994.1 alkaline phosphatase D family protein [Oscillatoria laete-virens NRMC-F 0139]
MNEEKSSKSTAETGIAEVATMVAVGTVTPTSVRLWARLDRISRLRLCLAHEGHSLCSELFEVSLSPESTTAFTYPNDFPGAAPLQANTRYSFVLQDEAGNTVGLGKFKTPAARPEDAPQIWTLAFVSCNQPFGDDAKVTIEAQNMLTAVRKAVGICEPEVILFLGDQIYSDAPKSMSLFAKRDDQPSVLDQTADEVHRRYNQRYRHSWQAPSWQAPSWQALHASACTACVPDDHDVVDNWGSDIRHNEPAWQRVRKAALDVAFSWQGQRSALPPNATSFQQGFRWQNAGIILLDTRTQRRLSPDPAQSQIMDAVQIERLEMFLASNTDLQVIFVAVPVPMIHVPQWLSDICHAIPFTGSDLNDRWSNPLWVHTRDRLLSILNNHRRIHPTQQIVLLSGDIHVGWAVSLGGGEANKEEFGKPILQFVSSAITNGEGSIVGTLSNALLRASRAMTAEIAGLQLRDVKGTDEATSNPFGGLNAGFVDVIRAEGTTTVRLRLISHGKG